MLFSSEKCMAMSSWINFKNVTLNEKNVKNSEYASIFIKWKKGQN